VTATDRREAMRERFKKFADQLNLGSALDIQELVYDDPDRADVAEWLNAHGWQAEGVHALDEMRRLDRLVELPDAHDRAAFSTFVTARRD
jgi:O-methyltransferase involved in polyketide biosynthesis